VQEEEEFDRVDPLARVQFPGQLQEITPRRDSFRKSLLAGASFTKGLWVQEEGVS
jgi:hypothetical protein